MIIYLVYFAASAFFAYLALKAPDRRRRIVFSLVSIGIMVFLAGMRSMHIGIDVANYHKLARYWGEATRKESLWAYLRYYKTTGYGEPLFALFIGAIGQLTGNYQVFLTLSHLIIISGVYIGAYRQREHVNPVLVLLLFYLFFFSHSLNIIRQYMAMAMIFAVFADIPQGKYLRYSMVVVTASMIHTTALIGFLPLIFYFVLYGNYRLPGKNGKFVPLMKTRVIMILSVVFAVVWGFLPVARLLLKLGVLPAKYDYYLFPEQLTPAFIVMGLLVMELCVVYWRREKMAARSPYFLFLVVCTVSYLFLQQLTGLVEYGKRIAAYLSLNNLLTIALIESSCKTKREKLVIGGGILAVALAYWLYMYILRNASQTFPYAFIQ